MPTSVIIRHCLRFPEAWVGGKFGPESGWLAVIVDALAAVLIWRLWPVGPRDDR